MHQTHAPSDCIKVVCAAPLAKPNRQLGGRLQQSLFDSGRNTCASSEEHTCAPGSRAAASHGRFENRGRCLQGAGQRCTERPEVRRGRRVVHQGECSPMQPRRDKRPNYRCSSPPPPTPATHATLRAGVEVAASRPPWCKRRPRPRQLSRAKALRSCRVALSDEDHVACLACAPRFGGRRAATLGEEFGIARLVRDAPSGRALGWQWQCNF